MQFCELTHDCRESVGAEAPINVRPLFESLRRTVASAVTTTDRTVQVVVTLLRWARDRGNR